MDRSNTWEIPIWKIEEKRKRNHPQVFETSDQAVEHTSQETDLSEEKEKDASGYDS